jgi:hypothetical protein
MLLKPFYMVIFIKVRGNGKNAWLAGALTERGTGLQNSVYGIFGRKAIVLRRGTISLSQDDISFTAFINQHRKLAKTFIIHFNLEASPTAAAEQHSSTPLSQAASGNAVADRRQPLRLVGRPGTELTLHGAFDDATGTVVGAVFRPTETREGYFAVMQQAIEQYSLHLGLYSDRHTIFRSPKETWTLEQELVGEPKPLSHFGKSMAELGITHIKP